jgi:two-component system sensor histidine kinase YesM
MMRRNRSLQFKITFSVVAYIIVIGVLGNIFLFIYLQDIVFRKAERLDKANMETVCTQLERNFENVLSLAAVCATEPEILYLISKKNRTERELILDSLKIQNQINAFLRSSPISSYIDKLILFNNGGLYAYAYNSRQIGYPSDENNIRNHPLYARFMADNLPRASGFGQSIGAVKRRDCYIFLFRITDPYDQTPDAFLYLEAGIDMITRVLRDYGTPPGVFVHIPETGEIILQGSPQFIRPQEGKLGYVPPDTEFPFRFRQEGRKYQLSRIPLENGMLVLYNQADVTNLAVDDKHILYTVLITVIMSLLAAAGLALSLSVFLTRPIHALISRIHKITVENDFTYDPKIEKPKDEIGRIGQAVNEMSGSIGRFLVEMEEQYRQQKNTEIALLQTQINPHFLYNTLDSIQWMAKIQNNHAIAGIINRFTSLLRSMVIHIDSGSVNRAGIKITLAEELLMIEDYSELMSLRFMGSFEMKNTIPEPFLDCLIPKFTLQPIVENAIIHGIRPSGKFGTITLNAADRNGFLDITVTDTGIGMSDLQLKHIKTKDNKKKRESPSLNNIGIANVEERIKLLYGDSCGLFYESRQGEYTKATVRVMMER